MSNLLFKFVHGLEWFGKEVGKAFTELPKIIRLTEDGEQAAKTAIPEVVAVIDDAGQLVTASAKDSGVFLVGLGKLSAAIATAVAAKALNVTADEAVAAAFEDFVKTFNAQNVSDVLAAWDKLATDVNTLDATVVIALQKIKQDA